MVLYFWLFIPVVSCAVLAAEKLLDLSFVEVESLTWHVESADL